MHFIIDTRLERLSEEWMRKFSNQFSTWLDLTWLAMSFTLLITTWLVALWINFAWSTKLSIDNSNSIHLFIISSFDYSIIKFIPKAIYTRFLVLRRNHLSKRGVKNNKKKTFFYWARIEKKWKERKWDVSGKVSARVESSKNNQEQKRDNRRWKTSRTTWKIASRSHFTAELWKLGRK